MKRKNMTGFILIALMVALVAIGVVLKKKRQAGMTAETDAVVASADNQFIGPEYKGRRDTIITCTFLVGGQTYKARIGLPGDQRSNYPPGHAGRVRYNPDKPEENEVIKTP